MTLAIYPYKFKGSWVFDFPDKNLDKEAFVQGADKILDYLTKDIPSAEDGFVLAFSDAPISGDAHSLNFLKSECGGSWYRLTTSPIRGDFVDGWLCPALFKFFPQAPPTIYVSARADPSIYNRWTNKITKMFSFKEPNVLQ